MPNIMPDTMNDYLSSRWTPVNDSAPSCDRTSVTLCIYGIDPDMVSKELGIEPTGWQKKGAPSPTRSGKERIGRINSWVLDSDNYVSSKDIRTHLDWLLEKIEPVTAKVLELQQLPDAKMSVRCSWWSAEKDGGSLALWPEQMERMAKANLELSLEIAYYGDDAEEDGEE